MSNNERMYAIVFDLDTDKLKALYHNTSWNNAYKDIEKVLKILICDCDFLIQSKLSIEDSYNFCN